MMKYTAMTHSGQIYNNNEDYFLLPSEKKQEEDYDIPSLFLLCDGMGSANTGSVASAMACQRLHERYYNGERPFPKLIKEVNKQIWDHAASSPKYRGMGTTLAAGLFTDENSFFYTLGDSRVYRLRNKKLTQLSEDHSIAWELYKAGEISKNDIRKHPYNNAITQALGLNNRLNKEQLNTCSSECKEGDCFLICSDGLTDMLSDKWIEKILNKSGTPETKAEALVAKANQFGGKDNITVILVEC